MPRKHDNTIVLFVRSDRSLLKWHWVWLDDWTAEVEVLHCHLFFGLCNCNTLQEVNFDLWDQIHETKIRTFDFGPFSGVFLWLVLFGALFVSCRCCCESSNYSGLDWEPLPPRGAENNAQIRAVLTDHYTLLYQTMSGSSVEESADF